MSAWADIGVKCVCIDGNWSEDVSATGRLPARSPVLRETLTISEIKEYQEGLFLKFEEIPETGSVGGWFWHIENFRPLTRLELDLTLFATMLLGTDAPADQSETV